MKIETVLKQQINWIPSATNKRFFTAEIDGVLAHLRLNNFPEEPLWTLILPTGEYDLEETPPLWQIPRLP